MLNLFAQAQGTADATVFSTRALSAEESANISARSRNLLENNH